MVNIGYHSRTQVRTLQQIIVVAVALAVLIAEAFKVVFLRASLLSALAEWSLVMLFIGGIIYLCFTIIYRVHERTVQQAEQIAALNAVAAAVSQSLQLSDVLDASLDKVLEATEAQGAVIHLLDEASQTLELAVRRGLVEGAVESRDRMRVGEGAVRRVIQTGAPVVSTQEPGEGEAPVLKTAVVPLQAKGRIVGTLQVATNKPEAFSDDEMVFLTAMANHIAVAVDNARLYAHVQAQAVRRQNAQQQLLRAARLATAGELAVGVAHEINNPLAVIMGTAQLLMQSSELHPSLVQDAELIFSNAERIATITHGFTELTQTQTVDYGPVDVNQVVRAATQDLDERLQEHHVSLQLDLASPLPMVSGNPGQLQQVLHKLLTNAVEAVTANGDGGWIRVTTQHLGSQVAIAVLDSGPGIPPADLPRIFEPSFTTKVSSGTLRGVGLGLFTAQAIVQAHHGTIEVDSAPGEGTTFVIRLPAMPE